MVAAQQPKVLWKVVSHLGNHCVAISRFLGAFWQQVYRPTPIATVSGLVQDRKRAPPFRARAVQQ